MFDFNKNDDPTGPSDHIRTTLDFLDNNIKMLKKLSEKVQVNYVENSNFANLLLERSSGI